MRGRALADAEGRGKSFYDWFRGDKSIGFDGQMQEFFRDWFRSGASIGFDELECPSWDLVQRGMQTVTMSTNQSRVGKGKGRKGDIWGEASASFPVFQ